MDKHTLKANKRTVLGHKVKNLRKQGLLPANIYGKKVKSLTIEVVEKDFTSVFAKVGETGLVELTVGDEKKPVLVHNVAYNPVTGKPLHIDFFQVDLKEKVTAKVKLVTVGESPAVKDKVGVLLHILSEVEVEALPSDLPENIEVDISALSALDETLKVSDLKVSDKIKILTNPVSEIIKVAPLVSKEAEKMAAEVAAAAAAAAASATAETEAATTTSDETVAKEPVKEAASDSKS